jgi:hypothetical protein
MVAGATLIGVIIPLDTQASNACSRRPEAGSDPLGVSGDIVQKSYDEGSWQPAILVCMIEILRRGNHGLGR